MSTPSTETIRGDLWKVRRDLDDSKRALSAWYVDSSLEATEADETLHTAAEALLRAVSTLTLTVERVAGLP